MKKTIKSVCLISFIFIILLALLSCKQNDILTFVETVISGDKTGTFDIEAKIEIDTKYLIKNNIITEEPEKLESVPSEILISLKGVIEEDNQFYANLKIDGNENISTEIDISTEIFGNQDKVYVKITDAVFVATEFLKAFKIVEPDVISLFENEITFNEKGDKYIVFDAVGFELKKLNSYLNYSDKFLTIKSIKNNFYKKGNKNAIDFKVFGKPDENALVKYNTAAEKVKKGLLKTDGYKYQYLDIIFSSDEKKSNVDIIGIKANGKSVIYDTIKTNIDTNGIYGDTDAVLECDMVPFRYIFETMGYEVDYDKDKEKAFFISKKNDKEYIEGTIKDGKTYLSIKQLLLLGFRLNFTAEGEFIEMTIYND